MTTAIKSCNCFHEWQNKVYGQGKRIMNKTNAGFRCTVCDKTFTPEIGKKK